MKTAAFEGMGFARVAALATALATALAASAGMAMAEQPASAKAPSATVTSRPLPSAPLPSALAPPSAPAKSNPQLKPMTVTLVRASGGCEPNCAEWIAATGMIDADTLPRFKKVLKTLGTRKPPVLISSNGGLVDEGLAIGRLLRGHGLDIAVANTIINPCGETDTACRSGKTPPTAYPKAFLARCASSCAFVLAGGVHRYAGPRTPVGVHQLKSMQTTAKILQKFRVEQHYVWGVPTETRRTLVSEKRIGERTVETKTPASAYAKVAAYFRDMGVTDAVMPLVKQTPHTSIHWLTRTELISTRLATDMIDGEQLITTPTPAKPRSASSAAP
jgi:hypothetical protein